MICKKCAALHTTHRSSTMKRHLHTPTKSYWQTSLLPLVLCGTVMAYPPTADETTAINTVLNDLCNQAVAHNVNGFMAHFSTNYRHNGTDYTMWSSNVAAGLGFVSACTFNNRSIDLVDATTAKVSGMLELTFNGETKRTPQPDYNQDNPGIGWLKKEAGGWKVIGNGYHATWNGVFTGNNLSHGNRFLRVRVENANENADPPVEIPVTSSNVSGPGIATTSLSAQEGMPGVEAFVTPSPLPSVGSVYTLQASYLNGTSDTIQFPIQSWVESAPNINVSGGGNQMTISWNDVSSEVPLASHYRVQVSGPGVFWVLDDIPLDTTAVRFNQDGAASGTLASGQTYSIEVMIFDLYDNFAYRIASHSQGSSPSPANDAFAFANDLGSAATGTASGDWTYATSEAEIGEPDLETAANPLPLPSPEDATLWYRWTAPAGASWAQLKVNGITNLVNTLAVYTGNRINSLTRVRLNQRKLRNYTRSGLHLDMAPNRVTFPVIPGQTYYIRPSVGLSRNDAMASLENPDLSFSLSLKTITTPTTAEEYVLRGRGKLENGTKADATSAKADFFQAISLSPTHSEARFLFALSQLLALENETGFSTLLVQLGIPNTGSFRTTGYTVPTDLLNNPVFAGGADTSQIIHWLKNSLLPKLVEVRTSLATITSTSFATDLTRSESGLADVAVDLADAKMLTAATRGLDFLVHLLTTYNLALPLQDLATLDTIGQLDAEHVLASHQQLLEFSGTDRRQQMADALRALQSDYLDASNTVNALRASSPYSAAGTVCDNLDAIQDTNNRNGLATAVNGLTQQVAIGGHAYQFSNFLNTNASLRDWMPDLRGNDAISTVPDPTFSGTAPGMAARQVDDGLYEIGRLYGMSQYSRDVAGYLDWLGLDARPNDDADRDGKTNFSEWIFASDVGSAGESDIQATIQRVPNAPGQPDEIRFSFLRAINLADWNVVVEVSDDLATWNPSDSILTLVGTEPTGDGFSEVVTYQLLPQGPPPARKYFRAVAKPKPAP